jgi:hypothetical protein
MLPKQYRYCTVCRQNHQQGKGHKYSTKHKQRLTQLLSKAHKRIQEIRVFLLNNNNVSSRLQPPQEDHQQQRKFWCHFCEQEIVEEKQISFMWGDVIQHLASAEHAAAVKAFWSEHGADVAKRHLYVLSEEDLEKWKEACEVPIAAAAAGGEVRNNGKERVETNNIHSNMAHFSEGHLFKLESRQSVSLVASIGTVQPLSVLTLGSLQNHGSAGTGDFCAATVHEHQPQSSMSGAEKVPNDGQLQPILSQGNLKPFVSSRSISVSLQQTQSASGLSKLDIFFVLSF